jgi:hypothetical protein
LQYENQFLFDLYRKNGDTVAEFILGCRDFIMMLFQQLQGVVIMRLKPSLIEAVPFETIRVARAAFPKGNLYLAMRDELGILFEDSDFAELSPRRGQPAFPPWRLALITVMQFLENLSDRQSADAVRSRIDWKYALGLKLTDSGFDYSVSCTQYSIVSVTNHNQIAVVTAVAVNR